MDANSQETETLQVNLIFWRNTIEKRIILPSVILLIAILISIGKYFYKSEQYKNWEPAPAVVTEVTVFETHRNSSSTHRIYYTFSVNNISYTGSESFSGKTDTYKAGDTHEIWFDPNDPNISSFNKPSAESAPVGPLIFGFILAFASYVYIGNTQKISKLY